MIAKMGGQEGGVEKRMGWEQQVDQKGEELLNSG